RARKPERAWGDDRPDRVLNDLQRTAPSGGVAPASAKEAAPRKPEDPHSLLKQARESYTAGKLEDAEKAAQRANSLKSGSWGLFDDSPDKVLADVRKARAKREQDESVRLMAEAHTTLEKANGDPKMLEEAERLTFRAERLHGPYSMWDLSERPSKLRGEIEAARGKSRKNRLPAAPGTEVAKTEPKNAVPAKAAAEPSAPAPMPKGPVLQASATVPASGPALPPPPEPVVPSPLPPGPA